MEIHYYQKFYHFISMPFFEGFATPLTQTEPSTPLVCKKLKIYKKFSSSFLESLHNGLASLLSTSWSHYIRTKWFQGYTPAQPEIFARISFYNHGHNISRIFDTLTKFLFTTSETKRDYS